MGIGMNGSSLWDHWLCSWNWSHLTNMTVQNKSSKEDMWPRGTCRMQAEGRPGRERTPICLWAHRFNSLSETHFQWLSLSTWSDIWSVVWGPTQTCPSSWQCPTPDKGKATFPNYWKVDLWKRLWWTNCWDCRGKWICTRSLGKQTRGISEKPVNWYFNARVLQVHWGCEVIFSDGLQNKRKSLHHERYQPYKLIHGRAINYQPPNPEGFLY